MSEGEGRDEHFRRWRERGNPDYWEWAEYRMGGTSDWLQERMELNLERGGTEEERRALIEAELALLGNTEFRGDRQILEGGAGVLEHGRRMEEQKRARGTPEEQMMRAMEEETNRPRRWHEQKAEDEVAEWLQAYETDVFQAQADLGQARRWLRHLEADVEEMSGTPTPREREEPWLYEHRRQNMEARQQQVRRARKGVAHAVATLRQKVSVAQTMRQFMAQKFKNWQSLRRRLYSPWNMNEGIEGAESREYLSDRDQRNNFNDWAREHVHRHQTRADQYEARAELNIRRAQATARRIRGRERHYYY